jgi:hypothetical protein
MATLGQAAIAVKKTTPMNTPTSAPEQAVRLASRADARARAAVARRDISGDDLRRSAR